MVKIQTRNPRKFKGRDISTTEAYIAARTVECPQQTHVAYYPLARGNFNPYFVRKLPG